MLLYSRHWPAAEEQGWHGVLPGRFPGGGIGDECPHTQVAAKDLSLAVDLARTEIQSFFGGDIQQFVSFGNL